MAKLSRRFLHRLRIVDWLVFWVALGVVVWASLVPQPVASGPENFDKALHFIAYFILSGLAAAAFQERRSVYLAALGLIVLGSGLEYVQGFVGRESSPFDQLANTLGVLAGGATARPAVEYLRRRFPEGRDSAAR